MKKPKVFISFVEEYWPGQKENTTVGRIEVHKPNDEYASEEIRWGTYKVKEFLEFREKWDFRDITESQLERLKDVVKNTYT